MKPRAVDRAYLAQPTRNSNAQDTQFLYELNDAMTAA
jgi:hypothetical protein